VLRAAESTGGGSFGLIMIVLLIAAMYFLMIRPQQKRRRESVQMQGTLRPGDEIVTIGGLYGTVTAVDDETLTLETSPGVTSRYARGAVGRVVTRSADPEEPDESDSESGTSDTQNSIEQV